MPGTDLLDLISKKEHEINLYLGDVSTEQFVEDVKNTLVNNTSKEIVQQTIDKLQKLL